MNTRAFALLVLSGMTLPACFSSPDEPKSTGASVQPEKSATGALTAQLPSSTYARAPAPGDAAGFVHSSARSRFLLGSPTSVQEGNVAKAIGSDGVFATNRVTGASRALRNADSPVIRRPPLTDSADRHNARVLDYFKTSGLPQDQIREAHVLTHMVSSGQTTKGSATPKFDGYTTVVTRQVGGISVPDSFAAARFNVDDEVVEEWVYWPTIPRGVIADAKAIGTAYAGPSFAAALPGRFRNSPGEVVIRHSDFADESGFQAFGSFDVHQTSEGNGGYRGGTHHFDINGREIIHPNRRPRTLTIDTPKFRY